MIYEAIQASVEAHKDQIRKLEGGIYVAHPLEVAIILAQNNAEEHVISAGILHDTIEDTSMSLEDIKAQFGSQIAEIVDGCTEPDKSLAWKDRKSWSIEHLKLSATYEMKLVTCADKLSNMRSIHRSYIINGSKTWSHFHAPYELQKWYYTSMLEGLSELAESDMYRELASLINKVFID